MMVAGGVMLQLSRVTTDCATTYVCACQGTGSAEVWLVHVVGRRNLPAVISQDLSFPEFLLHKLFEYVCSN